MTQRYPINAGGGPLPGIVGVVVAAPALGLYFRLVQHESWGIVIAVASAVAVLSIVAAVWGSRMTGKAIELTDGGISFPRWWSSRPETIYWNEIESCDSSFLASAAGPDRYLEIAYLGGRRRRIYLNSFSDSEGLEREIRNALAAKP